jgi:hypothetical protein
MSEGEAEPGFIVLNSYTEIVAALRGNSVPIVRV